MLIARGVAFVFKDARRCLQLGFDAIKHHCLNAYHPVLMWLLQKSLMRKQYNRILGSEPQVVAGLIESWGPVEHVVHHPEGVVSTAFSNHATQVVSVSMDNTVRILNATTGEVERILKGYEVGPDSLHSQVMGHARFLVLTIKQS